MTHDTHVTPDLVRGWSQEITTLDEQIAALQNDKKAIYERIRRDFDRRTAEAMKVAVKFLAMDSRKRAECLEFTDMGRKFLQMIENSGDQSADELWRAQREKDRGEPFEPETGELLDEDLEEVLEDFDLGGFGFDKAA
jgi:uncharacterized protein (UPF0335 family)